jgi:uronate dehydrogenase
LAHLADERRLLDVAPVKALTSAEIALAGDVTDLDRVRQAIAGCEACVHLAGIRSEAPFEQVLHTNINGTWTVFEAARLEGCGRVVFASSNHASGFHPVQGGGAVGPEVVRPDSYYGVSKAFGEALGRFYHDKFGMAVACLRIGSSLERPLQLRHLSTWLSDGDLVRLVEACLTYPELGFEILYGASANTRGWWDLGPARRIGYQPQDDAEAFAGAVEITPFGRFQGGEGYATPVPPLTDYPLTAPTDSPPTR